MIKMHERSLFRILLRSQWWVSALIAAAVFIAVRQFMPDYAALFATFPFTGIALYTGWRELRAPSTKRVAAILDAVRAMSWQEFSALCEASFRRDGYAVGPFEGDAADFRLHKEGRVVLASCKRWKVAQAGIAPLERLHQASEAEGAHECLFLAAAALSPNAQQFAAQKGMRLLGEAGLAQFVAGSMKTILPVSRT
jgi:restriction system protein